MSLPAPPSHFQGDDRLSQSAAEFSDWPAKSAGGEVPPRPISLEGETIALIDRALPREPRNFIIVVMLLAAGCWFTGLLLAPDTRHFLLAPEWHFQPLYLAVHFITLRLFVTVFSRNFMAGVAKLNVEPAQAWRLMKLVLGPVGGIAALAIAAPFCVIDYRYLIGEEYAKVGGEFLGSVDYLMWGIWCVEWYLNAFIWVVLIGFLLLTRWAISKHHFVATIEIVLHEKHYRPFLQMSAQGASMVLGFGVVNAVYIWYTGGGMSDYAGLIITGGLLVLGFVPPWMLLKAKVDRAVNEATFSLRQKLADRVQDWHRQDEVPDDKLAVVELRARLDDALAMLRISYLERLYRDLGQTEAKAILLKLLAPASTIGWKFFRTMSTGV